MNKVFVTAAMAAAVFASQAFADQITMNDGQTVEKATVLKVGVREIEYTVGKRKVLYAVRKSDVAKITYKDGTTDVFPLRERYGDRDGDELVRPYRGKGPGMGPGRERREFRGGPGERRLRGEELDEYPERDGPPPPNGPRARPRDGRPVGPQCDLYKDNDAPPPPPPAVAPPTPAPAPPIQPPTPPAKAQPAPTPPTQPPTPAKAQPAPPAPAVAPPAAPSAQPPAPPAKAEPGR